MKNILITPISRDSNTEQATYRTAIIDGIVISLFQDVLKIPDIFFYVRISLPLSGLIVVVGRNS